MGQRHEMPAVLGKTHPRFQTPHISILATGAVVLILAISGTFVYAVTVSILARLVIYLGTAASMIALRRRSDAPKALLHLPGGLLIPTAAILLSIWLMSNSTLREARDTSLAAALGFAIYLVSKFRRPHVLSQTENPPA